MRYIFTVDTDQYAGSFERQLVAYMTGQIGECEVGEEEANSFREEESQETFNLFQNIVDHVPDPDNGCIRPATIVATPGWFNTGMGNHHRDGTPDSEALEAYKKAKYEYELKYREMHAKYLEQLRAGREVGHWTEQTLLEEIQRYDRLLAETEANTTFHKYPAFMSVGLYLNSRPPQELVKILKRRAEAFAAKNSFNIEGYRLIIETLVYDSEDI